MIWLILIIIAGALLIELGALSVLVTVLAMSLKVVIGKLIFDGHLLWVVLLSSTKRQFLNAT